MVCGIGVTFGPGPFSCPARVLSSALPFQDYQCPRRGSEVAGAGDPGGPGGGRGGVDAVLKARRESHHSLGAGAQEPVATAFGQV